MYIFLIITEHHNVTGSYIKEQLKFKVFKKEILYQDIPDFSLVWHIRDFINLTVYLGGGD